MRDLPPPSAASQYDADPLKGIRSYQLLDFGAGRRLEQFGELRLDRPAVGTADLPRRQPDLWSTADARYEGSAGGRGAWQPANITGRDTRVFWGEELSLVVHPTAFGHVGLFPEQEPHWTWIMEQVSRYRRPCKVLNLFGYTGASTLAAAMAGAEVTHVDAARKAVTWARSNAFESGLKGAPIRWLVDDAVRFVARELRRGQGYDAVILDPPSYGHGPKGERWELDRHLPGLLMDCARLTAGRRAFILLTAHSPGYGAEALLDALGEVCRDTPGCCQSYEMRLATRHGRSLVLGAAARWSPGG